MHELAYFRLKQWNKPWEILQEEIILLPSPVFCNRNVSFRSVSEHLLEVLLFWTPKSWCSPLSLTLALQSWPGLRYFSFLSADPFQKFLLPTQPLAGHSVTPRLQSHLCFERDSSGRTSPWKWNGFFLWHCFSWATGFPGSQKLHGQRAACSPCERYLLSQCAGAGKGHSVCSLTPCVCVCANTAGTEPLLHCPFESTFIGQANALEQVQQWIVCFFPSQSNLQWGHSSRKSNQVITGNQGLLNTGQGSPFELLVMSFKLHSGSGLAVQLQVQHNLSASPDGHLCHTPHKIWNQKLYGPPKLSQSSEKTLT